MGTVVDWIAETETHSHETQKQLASIVRYFSLAINCKLGKYLLSVYYVASTVLSISLLLVPLSPQQFHEIGTYEKTVPQSC